MRSPISILSAIGIVMCLLPIGLGAQGQQVPSSDSIEQLPTLPSIALFEGAESKNCPTGTGMFTLLGSRAVLTIPQVPPVAKERAVPTDIDSVLFGRAIFRQSVLPDHSGKLFEFIGKTCTVEITIRYR